MVALFFPSNWTRCSSSGMNFQNLSSVITSILLLYTAPLRTLIAVEACMIYLFADILPYFSGTCWKIKNPILNGIAFHQLFFILVEVCLAKCWQFFTKKPTEHFCRLSDSYLNSNCLLVVTYITQTRNNMLTEQLFVVFILWGVWGMHEYLGFTLRGLQCFLNRLWHWIFVFVYFPVVCLLAAWKKDMQNI